MRHIPAAASIRAWTSGVFRVVEFYRQNENGFINGRESWCNREDCRPSVFDVINLPLQMVMALKGFDDDFDNIFILWPFR